MKALTLVRRIALMTLIWAGVAAHVQAEVVLSSPVIRDIGHTFGFHVGQTRSLQRIAINYPTLSGAVQVAEASFAATFGDSLAQIDARMSTWNPTEWQRIKAEITSRSETTLSSQAISRADAERFIELVRTRSKGSMPSPVIETLLMFKPGYQRRPVTEFLEGHRQRYRSDGTGKAKGIAFDLQAPKSWQVADGNRPNIVTKFVSENGRGLEIFMVLITSLVGENEPPITAAEIEEAQRPQVIKDMLPEGATYIASGKYTLETLPGYWVRFDLNGRRGRQAIGMSVIMYSLLYKNHLIQMQGQVAAPAENSAGLGARFDRFETMFDQIAQSLVIPAIYGR